MRLFFSILLYLIFTLGYAIPGNNVEYPFLTHEIEYEIGVPYEYKCLVKAEGRLISVTYTDQHIGCEENYCLQLENWQIININQLCEVVMSFKGEYIGDSLINDCEYIKLSIDNVTKIILVDRNIPSPIAISQLCDYMNLYCINYENNN